MKKLVVLSVLIFTIVSAAEIISARADDVVPITNQPTVTPNTTSEDIENIVKTSFILEYLRQGGSLDFSNTSDNYSYSDFINDFWNTLESVSNGLADIYNYINPFDSFDMEKVPYNIPVFETGVNIFRNMLPSYLSNNTSDEIIPNPDPNYSTYIDYINGSGFWWKNFPNMDGFNQSGALRYYPPNLVSWVADTRVNTFPYNRPLYGSSFYCYTSNIIDVYIYQTDENSYSCNLNLSYLENFHFNNQYYKRGILGTYGDGTFDGYDNDLGTLTYIQNGSLTSIFNQLSLKFRNINIYVNGEPWSIVGQAQRYNVGLGTGTYLTETNIPIEFKFDENIELYFDLSDLLDKIEYSIENKLTVDFPNFSDLIVDTNGQQTFAVTIFQDDKTIDDEYLKEYGAMIPVFPLWIDYPVDLRDVNIVATVGIEDVIPDDIIELFGAFFIGMLCITMLHRLLE